MDERVFILLAAAAIVVLGPIMCSNPETKTDGVFESAMEKADKGLPLNEREEKRVKDVMNYDQNKEIERIERKNGQR